MTIDERLQRALHDEAAAIDAATDPDGTAWAVVQRRAAAARRTARIRFGALAAAAVVMVVVLAAALLANGDDPERVQVGPTDTTTETQTTDTTEPPPTTTTTAPAPPDEAAFPGIWPLASQADVIGYKARPGAEEAYRNPEQVAMEFARLYLKMHDAVLVSADRPTTFTVSPRRGHPMKTTIEVADVGGVYTVTGAKTRNIEVTSPGPNSVVGRPVQVRGRSSAFEAHVNVEVREAGGPLLGDGYVMGGGGMDLEPFSGAISYFPPAQKSGAVVFFTNSAENGMVQEATVVRVVFGNMAQEGTAIGVFFHRNDDLIRVERRTTSSAVLSTALSELVAGPQPGDGRDLTSLFNETTKDIIASVAIDNASVATVEFNREVPDANSAAGSEAMLAELNATVFQFPNIKRIEYRLRGSCDAFWQWLQYGDCRMVDRP